MYTKQELDSVKFTILKDIMHSTHYLFPDWPKTYG